MDETYKKIDRPVQADKSFDTQKKRDKSLFILIFGIIILLFLVSLVSYNLGKMNSSKNESPKTKGKLGQKVVENSGMKLSAQPSETTSNWNTYTSSRYGFTINYPKKISRSPEEWEYDEKENSVLFGTPTSRMGGYIWAVNIVENNDLEALISKIGDQFTDRRESRQNININGYPALLVTVTTGKYSEWIAKSVFIMQDTKIYEIGNGAVDMPEFDTFYNSINLNLTDLSNKLISPKTNIPTALPNRNNNTSVYIHPELKYSLEYPSSWVGVTKPKYQNEYQGFQAHTADYEITGMGEHDGAMIHVGVENSTFKSVDDKFNSEYISVNHSKNINRFKINNEEALQFDFCWEGCGNMTYLIKNGKLYTISYPYNDEISKQKEWDTYVNLINSLKVN